MKIPVERYEDLRDNGLIRAYFGDMGLCYDTDPFTKRHADVLLEATLLENYIIERERKRKENESETKTS